MKKLFIFFIIIATSFVAVCQKYTVNCIGRECFDKVPYLKKDTIYFQKCKFDLVKDKVYVGVENPDNIYLIEVIPVQRDFLGIWKSRVKMKITIKYNSPKDIRKGKYLSKR